MDSVEIREVERTELTALLELYRHLHSEDAPLPDNSIVEDIWDEMVSTPRIKCFGLYDSGRLAASCILNLIPNLTRGAKPYGLIETVVTHSDFRRRGYGRAVLLHALNCAWQADCYKVMLLTGRKDGAIRSFYCSAGFDPELKQAYEIRRTRLLPLKDRINNT